MWESAGNEDVSGVQTEQISKHWEVDSKESAARHLFCFLFFLLPSIKSAWKNKTKFNNWIARISFLQTQESFTCKKIKLCHHCACVRKSKIWNSFDGAEGGKIETGTCPFYTGNGIWSLNLGTRNGIKAKFRLGNGTSSKAMLRANNAGKGR